MKLCWIHFLTNSLKLNQEGSFHHSNKENVTLLRRLIFRNMCSYDLILSQGEHVSRSIKITF